MEWLGKELVFIVNSGLILTLLIIFCNMQLKSEYGWRWFDLDERRDFIDYSTLVTSGGWRSGFRAS
ncbi:hypothetical protein Hanom_Chr02g00106611 [Helianthus anomalus]